MKTVREIADLSAAEIVALSRLVTDAEAKKASAALTPGDHKVAMDLHVEVDLTRGENFEQEIVEKAEPWLLLAVALSHLNGVTVASIVREALSADPKMVEGLKEKAAEAIKAVKEPTLTAMNGKVTVPVVKVAKAA